VILLLCTATAGDARAAELPQELKDGIEAYNQVEYQPALMYLRSALQRVKGPRLLAITYFYLGCTYLALEENTKAQAAFETLLAFQPDYVPNRRLTSPKIAGFLSRVRNEYPTPAAAPTLAHQPPLEAGSGQTRLALEVQHLSPRLRPVLHYRSSTTPEYLTLEAYEVLGSLARFAMPTRERSTTLYYFALSTRSGITVRRLGGPKRPFRLQGESRARAGAAAPWYRRWWVWTIAGVVVAGASAGAAYALTRGSDQSRVEVVIFRRNAGGTAVELFGP
jgi:tetratricopeptide (TPR) repeat protein